MINKKLMLISKVIFIIFISVFFYACGSHTHNYELNSDSSNHYYECDCGDIIDVTPHQFSWIVDKETSGFESGLKHEECEVCKYKQNELTVIDRIEVSEKDIQNIKKISLRTDDKYDLIIFSYDLKEECINYGLGGKTFYTNYYCKNDVDNYYIVSTYVDEDKYIKPRDRLRGDSDYYSNVEWIRYESLEDVQKEYNGKMISDLFMVYDVTIVKDLIHDIDYNIECKYYREIRHAFIYDLEIRDYNIYPDFILWDLRDMENTDNIFFTDLTFKTSVSEAYINEESEIFYVFNSYVIEIPSENYIRYRSREIFPFDALDPYFLEISEYLIDASFLNEIRYYFDEYRDIVYCQKVMIKAKDLKEIILGRKQ